MKIKFISKHAEYLVHPVPMKKVVPRWYKDMEKYINKDLNLGTVKNCVPVLDSVTMGYALLSSIDIMFTKTINDNQTVDVKVQSGRLNEFEHLDMLKNIPQEINYHVSAHSSYEFAKKMVYKNEIPIAFKFGNPWIIKTPPGYSCLFTSPFNTEERDIRIVTGVVDTDRYETYVNFPFFLKDWDEKLSPQKIIPKGYPIALVFPFARNDWHMKVSNDTDKNHKMRSKWLFNFATYMVDMYKNNAWVRKNYK